MKTVRIVDGLYPALSGRFSASPIPLPSDVDYAWGAISKPDGSPALRYVFDPDPKFIRAGAGDIGSFGDAWRDCASGTKWSTNDGKSFVTGTDMNGQPSLTLDSATAVLRPSSLATFNHDAFSFFIVFSSENTGVGKIILGRDELGTVTPVNGSCTVILSSSGGILVYFGDASAALVEAGQDWTGEPVLLGVTFSIERGVSIRRNGIEVVRAAGRTAPLIGTAIRLFSGPDTSSRFSGKSGKIVIADVDMSAPEYESGLSAIEDHLLELYGIA